MKELRIFYLKDTIIWAHGLEGGGEFLTSVEDDLKSLPEGTQCIELTDSNQIEAFNASSTNTIQNGQLIIGAPDKPIMELVAVAHWAKISAFNAGAEKPLTVIRNYQGQDFTVNCYVTQSLVNDYQAGKLVIGDFVIVEFVDGDLDKPIAIAKVYKTW